MADYLIMLTYILVMNIAVWHIFHKKAIQKVKHFLQYMYTGIEKSTLIWITQKAYVNKYEFIK